MYDKLYTVIYCRVFVVIMYWGGCRLDRLGSLITYLFYHPFHYHARSITSIELLNFFCFFLLSYILDTFLLFYVSMSITMK